MGNKVIETPVARIEFKVSPSRKDIENLIYLLKVQALMIDEDYDRRREVATSGK